ncbi:hypothetical protein HKX48_005143 [Thoreauomyces humboldtii]|nr:hypothetical protein HKX48_005143 [Thoreauomyces humboldtii]
MTDGNLPPAPPASSSLRTHFSYARRLCVLFESSPHSPTSPSFQSHVAAAHASLSLCQNLVRSLAVFSPNETIEDVNTGDIRYIVIDALLADVETRSVGGDRLAALERARLLYEAFLARCDGLECLGEEERTWREMRGGDEDDSTDGQAVAKGGPKMSDAERRRSDKIARYKKEKATLAQIKELHARITSQNKTGPDALDDDDIEGLPADEEHLRTLSLLTLSLTVQKSLDALRLIDEERSLLLQFAASTPSPSSLIAPPDTSTLLDAARAPRVPASGPLLGSKGKILRPFILTSERQQIRDGVFRYGHNLPTMSVEEYLEEEMNRGNFLSGGGKDQESGKKEVDDQDQEGQDQETYKARAWDEFKDENPVGWGNRYNKG